MRAHSACSLALAAPLRTRAHRAAICAPGSLLRPAEALHAQHSNACVALTGIVGRGGCAGARPRAARLAVRASSGEGSAHGAPPQSSPEGHGGFVGASPQPSPSAAAGGAEAGSRRGPQRSPASGSASASVSAAAAEAEADARPEAEAEKGTRVRLRAQTYGVIRRRTPGSGRIKPGLLPPPLDVRTLRHLYSYGWWPTLADVEAAVSKPGRFETFCFETAGPAIDFIAETLREQPVRRNGLAAAASVLQRQPKLQTRRADKMAETIELLRAEGLDAAKLAAAHPDILSRSLESMKAKLRFLRNCMGVSNEQLNTAWGMLLTVPQRRLRERFFYSRLCDAGFLQRYSATTMAGPPDAAFVARVHGCTPEELEEGELEEYHTLIASPEFEAFCAAEEAKLTAEAALSRM